MTSTVKIIIALVVIIGVIAVGSTIAAFEYYSSTLPNRDVAHPVVLAIIYPNQATDGYFGLAYWDMNGGLPLYLGHGQTHTIPWTLTNRDAATSHTLDSVTTGFSGGFTVQSVTPNLPLTVAGGATIALNFTIKAPDTDYNGPVTIDLFTQG